MLLGFNFLKLAFFLNTSFHVFRCQFSDFSDFSHSSAPEIYTLGVRSTPDRANSGMAFSRSCDQRKSEKM